MISIGATSTGQYWDKKLMLPGQTLFRGPTRKIGKTNKLKKKFRASKVSRSPGPTGTRLGKPP